MDKNVTKSEAEVKIVIHFDAAGILVNDSFENS